MKKANFEFENNPPAGNVNARGCNAIMFKNACRNTPAVNVMYINGSPIYEGEMLSLCCDLGEVDETVYNVSYTGAGASAEFVVIRKFSEDVRK